MNLFQPVLIMYLVTRVLTSFNQFKLKGKELLLKSCFSGTPKRVKILDYQGLTLGHPALDIWSIIYSATDATYRADHMEEDLLAYFTILSGYMETQVNFTEFRQELEERRVMGMVMYGKFKDLYQV